MAALMNFERAAGSDADPETASVVLHRRIEFHVARKPFNGFANNCSSSGFKLVTLNPNSEPHNKEYGLIKKTEKLELSESSGLDPELSLGITFRRIGAGLRNLGNTCFLNSVLQCLTYTEPLAAYLQSGKHQNSCRTAGFCALCAIQKHVSRALQSTGRILEPKDLVSNLRCISRNFRNARQEDAHEYMMNLLESMHKCCLPTGVPSESPSAYEKSLVHKIFGGRLRSQVKCMQCSFCSDKFDPFLDLSLEIMKADSLHKALAHFTAKEQLDGGAKQYHCQQCKQKVKALKQLTIHKAPHVLTIHLKRFGSHVQGQKIDKTITFCPTLDLKPFVTGSFDGDLKYTLYGVLVHAGWSTHSGHYYCFVRTSSGMWYSLDDNQVVQVSERRVLEQKAYMLFYVRDRRKFGTKKSVDVDQKENMVMNAIGNAAYSKLNQETKETGQNGLLEKKLDGSFSAALSERVAPIATAPKETPLKNISFHNANGAMTANCFSLKRGPQPQPSSVVLPTKDSKDCSYVNANSMGLHVKSGSSIEASGDTVNLSNASKIVGCRDNCCAVQDINASAMISRDCNVPWDSFNKKEFSVFVALPSSYCKDSPNETPSKLSDKPLNSDILCTSFGDTCSMAGTNPEKCDNKVIPTGAIEEALSKIGGIKSLKQCSIEENQVGDFYKNSGDSNQSKQRITDTQSKLSSDLLTTTERLSNGMANTKRTKLKVRKKLFKYQVSSMQLSSNIIFSVAFHKRRKHHPSQNRSSNSKHSLCWNDLPSDLGPSVSNKSLSTPINQCTYPQKKKAKRGSDNKDELIIQNISSNGIMSNIVFNDEYRESTVGIGTKQSLIGQSASLEPRDSEDYRSEWRQAGTRGLEETTVTRWDAVDVPLSEKLEPREAETVQIGYVGDEWDEEYDRGKRKKVRLNRISFGGPNLFQEIATRNEKIKRSKLDRSNSENHPFRIDGATRNE